MEDVIEFAAVATVIIGLVGALCTIGVITFKMLTKPSAKPAALSRAEEERFERLQQSVDAIAIEVERIAEAQRFSAKLMNERSEQGVLPR